jgi:hypothetical protein
VLITACMILSPCVQARLPSTALRELLELCVSAGNGPGAQVSPRLSHDT